MCGNVQFFRSEFISEVVLNSAIQGGTREFSLVVTSRKKFIFFNMSLMLSTILSLLNAILDAIVMILHSLQL